MWTVRRDFAFEAAHALPHLPEGHKCRQLHGHSYRVRIEVCADRLDARGFVADFAELGRAMHPILVRLDHSNLNDLFEFPTTAEHLAAWIFHEVRRNIPAISRVVLHETAQTSAIFEG